MTPEERFKRIQNFMDTMAEHQARHDEELRQLTGKIGTVTSQIGALTTQVGTLTSATTDLAGVSRHLVNVQGELVESNSLLRQLVESHARRLDRLEGDSLN